MSINHMKKILIAALVSLSLTISAQPDNLYSGPPAFQGAKVVGNYPTTDFLFTLPAIGKRPIEFQAENLPKGLTIDKQTGIITGNVKEPGEYKVRVVAMNSIGNVSEELKIVIGDKLCLTPPLGWNSWNVFTSDISEKLLMEIADAMVKNGMRDMGYQYINIDDFWHAPQREADGRPKADTAKFPHGMKYLADYMHSRGLKLGIYSCAGNMTCGKQFGGYQHEEVDARTYAEWGIDLLKYDYCFAAPPQKDAIDRYTAMGTALKRSGRSIVFSICEWGGRKPWEWGAGTAGSYWRTTGDIADEWNDKPGYNGVMKILSKEKGLEKYAAPGHWNDPDMLIVGNHGTGKATGRGGKSKGLSQDEYYSHFAMWCMLNAPLLTSCDLRSVSKADLDIMTNPLLLAINQDGLGEQAHLVKKQKGLWFYSKKMSGGQYAVAILNTGKKGCPYSLKTDDFGIKATSPQHLIIQPSKSGNSLNTLIQPHATAVYIISEVAL